MSESPAESAFTHAADWSWATVMVVDDEKVNRALLGGIVSRQGVGAVIEAVDGLDCLAKLENSRPDLIILDIVMPNMDGFTACAKIRAMPQWADIPILVQTALTAPRDVLACFQAGASDVLAKPIRPAELSARLRVHLENRRMLRELQESNNRIQREMQGAREMQRSLFPSHTRLQEIEKRAGLHIEGNVMALDGVGGDIWTMHQLDDNCTAVISADFSGHGLMAALNTFWLHAFVGKRTEDMRDPAAFMKMLNGALRANLMRGHFATMFMCVIDLNASELQWAGAGAPKPFLMVDGQLHELDTTGLPLGLSERAMYRNHSIAFPPGAELFVFSDGFSDLLDENGRRIETSGLRERFTSFRAKTAHPDLSEIWAAMGADCPERRVDDTTALWIRRASVEDRHRDDPRYLAPAGFQLPELTWWVNVLGLPPRAEPSCPNALPVHLTASGLDECLTAAMQAPFAAIIELSPEQLTQDPPEELVQPMDEPHILASLLTTTAYRLPLAALFCDALVRGNFIAEDVKGDILISLQEAVANGVVHGNLGLHSPRRAFEDMRGYWAEIRRRLALPAIGRRRITLEARLSGEHVLISVTDQGEGFNPDLVQSRDPSKPHGKGLNLIKQTALDSEFSLSGRRHTLTFARK